MNTAKVDNIRDQASVWFLRLQSSNVSADDLKSFGEWLLQDPEHETEYFALEELWQDLDEAANDSLVRSRRRHLTRPAAKNWHKRRGIIFAAAASLVMALALGFFHTLAPESKGEQYSTALGEQRVVVLDDGSVITLDTLTSLTVYYLAQQRRIELHYGRADFQVEKDRARPFVVAAGPGFVQALGTRFDVYKSKHDITVTLFEGAVEIQPVDKSNNSDAERVTMQPVVLQPGERVTYNLRSEIIASVSKVNTRRVSAWRNRRLDFENTPLSKVVYEVNRYSTTRLELGDKSLENLVVSGVFEVDRTEELVKALTLHFGMRAVYGGARQIVLMPERDQ